MALFSLLFLSVAVNSAFSARIAGFWTIGGSQYINMKQTLEELATRGHEVKKKLQCIQEFNRTLLVKGEHEFSFLVHSCKQSLVWSSIFLYIVEL